MELDKGVLEKLENIDLTAGVPQEEPQRQYYYIAKCRKLLGERSERLGRKLTAAVVTFGCQMNARDSEKLMGILKAVGYEETDSEDADFVLYNTCTVRENANLRVYGRLGHLGARKKEHSDKMIALCGCMMQEQEVVDKIVNSYHFVDIVFGTHNIFKLAELICSRLESGSMIVDIWKDSNQIVEELPSQRKYPFKQGVNITFGCDNFCTYCIVPYVRGRERSRKPEDILREIEQLAANGVVEIMLLGQNVNSYGKGLDVSITFAELLSEVEKIPGIERIRFMTPHPKDLSNELIAVMRDSDKICHHIHLPLQSGSTRLLQRMNRRYTKEQYLSLVETIRREIPDIALTTDIIVGFPGETEEDFRETMDVVTRARFDRAFTFIYSKRTGTPAAGFSDQIPQEVVKDRFDRLLDRLNHLSAQNIDRLVGTVQKVLVEGVNDHDASQVTGRMCNNTLVHFAGSSALVGKIVDVKLTEGKGFYYIGRLHT